MTLHNHFHSCLDGIHREGRYRVFTDLERHAERPPHATWRSGSEYNFLDDTACNLASLNLMAFSATPGGFDVAAFEHAVRLWTIVLEISVLMAQFPSKEIARRSYDFRTLGLGYANLGGLLMSMGLPYDDAAGRALGGAITALMTGASYAVSAEMAGDPGLSPRGAFSGYAENR